MTDDSTMPFGVHYGEKLANVPPDYLLWLYENDKCFGELKTYIKENLDVIKSEIKNKKNGNSKK